MYVRAHGHEVQTATLVLVKTIHTSLIVHGKPTVTLTAPSEVEVVQTRAGLIAIKHHGMAIGIAIVVILGCAI